MVRTFLRFTQASYAEVRRVVWPTRAETLQSTLGVLFMVTVMGLILWAIDSFLLKIVARLTGYGVD